MTFMIDNNGKPVFPRTTTDDGSVDALIRFVTRVHAAQRVQAAFRAGWYIWGQAKQGSNLRVSLRALLPLLALFLFAGCGDVTPIAADAGDVVETAPATDARPQNDASAPTVDALPQSDSVVSPRDGIAGGDNHDSGVVPPPSASCQAADGCAACTQAGPTGPGYASAAQCAAVITCVLAGDGGSYPWQTCHNIATGGGAQWGGLACAQQLVKACP